LTLHPSDLEQDPDTLEQVEKATLRMVTQAVWSFLDDAAQIFGQEEDKPADIAEDVTREALDSLGFSRIPIRLFGNIDFKRARYIFHPEYSIKQALFVDSKAEAPEGSATTTIQMSQTSMYVRQRRGGRRMDVAGSLPAVLQKGGDCYLTTTVFVKYHYEGTIDGPKTLLNVVLACLPNGMLQSRYNPDETHTIWRAGRNAPTRGEPFRVRIHFGDLKAKANWRVQTISVQPRRQVAWDD